MKVFFDSSVLIAAFLADHEHHETSLAALVEAPSKDSFCAAHSLAEAYSILTRLPGQHRVTPEHALFFVNDLCDRLALVTLAAPQYQTVVTASARDRITGGAIYDALILQCAVKARAESVLTWNLRDFRRICPELAPIIRTPG